ncbi:MAG: hypothetical protein L0H31_03790 [Nocardioidaceae bacterium]|nr:hypothetical protein [Nocardioidaceae bacterium]
MLARALLGLLGLVLAGYGAVLLLSRQDGDQIRDGLVWLIAGVLVHDALLAPVVLGLCLVGRLMLPTRYRRAATVALIIVGPLSLLAIPVLGRFGARPDNPTLLDRPYLAAWLVLLIIAAAAVIAVGRIVGSSPAGVEETQGGAADGTGPGRR